MRITAAINHFLYFLQKEKQVSSYTIRNYRHYLHRFLQFCARHSPPLSAVSDINNYIISEYQLFLTSLIDQQRVPLSRKTKIYHLIALRQLIRYLRQQGLSRLSFRLVKLDKMSQIEPKFVQQSAIERFLSMPVVSTAMGLRDKAIVELLASHGLTVSELVRLNRDNINLAKKTITVFGRASRKRQLTLSDRVVHWLGRYLVTRIDSYPPVFIRYAGKRIDPAHAAREARLSARSVQRLVKKYSRQARLATLVTPQTIRHSFAIEALQAGVAKDSVQQLLGHQTDVATRQYQRLVKTKVQK